jgi:hypothetical protein
MTEPKHCDDYIDDLDQPEALRTFLARARAPAHGHLSSDPFPTLFADYEGTTVRVVMASRLGDVGFTYDLTKDHGYERRVFLEALANFRAVP